MAAKSDKVIITCAVTGAIHTPTMSDALPVTPDQIAEQAIGAAEAGAAILHLHARNPQDGRPTGDPAVFMQFLPRIKQATDAVINITTGGSPTMAVEERLAGVMKFSPEMCSLNMGSMNFALYPMAARYKKWKHDWEEQYLLGTNQTIFRNTFADIEKISKLMGEGHGTKFEHECYDVGHLYNLAHGVDKGWFKPPIFLQLIFGILGGIGADMENLMFMKRTADKLFGDDYQWSVLGAGRIQIPFATQAVMMGGNVRVGLEDSLYIGRGQLAKSNAEQVAKMRRLIEELGYQVATPKEAREMLGLKGQDRDEVLRRSAMASDTIVDIYCHIFPDKFFQEMNRIAPRLGNIGARLRGVKKLFDLDERFREMDQFGDYREIISLPNPPIEDLAAGETGLNLARIGNDAMAELCARHPERFPTFVAARVDDRRRGLGEGGAARGQGARRRRHPDLHQRRRPAARRSRLRADLRDHGRARPADLAASGAHRQPCRTIRPSRSRASRCGGASAGPTTPRWRWCGWCSAACSTAIPGSRSSPTISAA